LILVDELDNNYGDLYSASVSAQSVWRRVSVRTWGTALAVLSMVFAMVLPMHSLEPFLLLLSSVFVPLFGVMLGWLLWRPERVEASVIGVRWAPAAVWLIGIGVYHGLAQWAPELGSALPTLALTFVLARVAVRMEVVRWHAA
jgi:purine-cytosine permease-like protein